MVNCVYDKGIIDCAGTDGYIIRNCDYLWSIA